MLVAGWKGVPSPGVQVFFQLSRALSTDHKIIIKISDTNPDPLPFGHLDLDPNCAKKLDPGQ